MNTTGPLMEGNLALDLINTEEERRGVRQDYIGTSEEFGMWLSDEELAGAVSRVQLPFEVDVWTPEAMEKVHQLRAEVRDNLEEAVEDETVDPQFVKRLETYIGKAPYVMKLHEGRVVYIPIGTALERLYSLVATEVLKLIGEGQIPHLKKCANPKCLFMFVDMSGRRKWCSMQRCGNRAKVLKHLQRTSSYPTSE